MVVHDRTHLEVGNAVAEAGGEPIPSDARWAAAGSLALWLGGVASGKLLLYTNHLLFAADEWMP